MNLRLTLALTVVLRLVRRGSSNSLPLETEIQNVTALRNLFSDVNRRLHSLLNRKVCYDELGCLTYNSSWYNVPYRMINVLPLSREDINTSFVLYTRDNPNSRIMFTARNLQLIREKFRPQQPVKFIIHGYLQNGVTDPWIKSLADLLLKVGDFNVISVDWSRGARPMYVSAIANIRVVGLEIAHLVKVLIKEFDIRPHDVHLIGHSLGAQAAGYAGERIPDLGRITGLDPAGPSFQWMPSFVRLDPSDASFVDVIHTNAKQYLFEMKFGMIQPVGHIDFYINGGIDQPGCELASLVASMTTQEPTHVDDIVFCSHRRSVDLFGESLTSSLNLVGYECNDYESFLRGECYSCGSDDTRCAKVGLDAALYPQRTRKNVKLFLPTRSSSPYAVYCYHADIRTAQPRDYSSSTVYGLLTMSVEGTLGQVANVSAMSNQTIVIQHGSDKLLLFTSEINLGEIVRATLHWQDRSYTVPPSAIYVNYIEITLLNDYPEKVRLERKVRLCTQEGSDNVEIPSNGYGTFSRC